jgi:hypothetical protein
MPDPLRGLPVGTPAKLPLISGRTIYTTAGKKVLVPLPAGQELSDAVPAKDGWVIYTSDARTSSDALWHLTSGGKLVKILANLGTGWSVSPDGTSLYVYVVKEGFRRIDIASGRTTARHTVTDAEQNSGDYNNPVSGGPNMVVVSGGTGGEDPQIGVWDIAGDQIRTIDTRMSRATLLPNGHLIAGIVTATGENSRVCLSEISLTVNAKPVPGTPCIHGGLNALQPSPSGDRVLASYYADGGGLVQEIWPVTGNAAPVRLPLRDFSGHLYWESKDSVLIAGPNGQDGIEIARCQIPAKRCERAPLPAGIPAKGARTLNNSR